jgi:DNA-binding NarL/FixJ family response regulator
VDFPPAKLLIVDDSRMVRERLVALAAEIPGLTLVGAAATAAEAILVFDREKPGAVVLDIGLPEVDGLAVLRHIRRQTSAAVVLIFTGQSSPEMVQSCRALGANQVFDKSADLDSLFDALSRLGAGENPDGATLAPVADQLGGR